jgi:hypothetical protein
MAPLENGQEFGALHLTFKPESGATEPVPAARGSIGPRTQVVVDHSRAYVSKQQHGKTLVQHEKI